MTPILLLYRANGSQKKLLNSVCREIEDNAEQLIKIAKISKERDVIEQRSMVYCAGGSFAKPPLSHVKKELHQFERFAEFSRARQNAYCTITTRNVHD